MDERTREALSAAFDDETDELTLRRLLAEPDREVVLDQWQRWQTVRSLLSETEQSYAGIDVAAAVRAEIDGGSAEMREARTEHPRARRQPFAFVAMAASVVMAVLVGVGVGHQWGSAQEVAALAQVSAEPVADASEGSITMVAVQEADAFGEVPQLSLQQLDEAQRQHLSMYLLRHAQYGSPGTARATVGFARVASAEMPAR
ncbi:MAG: sigma-E factor negative regulatory protein [Gammaproteobacteria bacterium]|nr:sigma-E factor negative regulatory protein [Gammaproteobacteria bacterium]